MKTTFLGLIVDEQLSWSSHITSINNCIKQYIGVLYKRKPLLSHDCRRMLFFAIVYPKLIYALELFGTAAKTLLDPLKVTVNRILRVLQDCGRNSNVISLYSNYNTLPISELFKFVVGIIIFKCLYDPNISQSLHDALIINNPVHMYSTRSLNNMILYRSNAPSYYASLSYLYCTLWNDIPLSIKNIAFLNKFKKTYKLHLLQSINITQTV